MTRIITAAIALLALASSAAAQMVIQPPPMVVTPPPFVVTPPPVVVAPPPPPTCVVNLPPWEWLNLRTFPNGPIIGAMPPGTPLALFNVSGRWGYVQSPIGMGWAFLPYTVCQ